MRHSQWYDNMEYVTWWFKSQRIHFAFQEQDTKFLSKKILVNIDTECRFDNISLFPHASTVILMYIHLLLYWCIFIYCYIDAYASTVILMHMHLLLYWCIFIYCYIDAYTSTVILMHMNLLLYWCICNSLCRNLSLINHYCLVLFVDASVIIVLGFKYWTVKFPIVSLVIIIRIFILIEFVHVSMYVIIIWLLSVIMIVIMVSIVYLLYLIGLSLG